MPELPEVETTRRGIEGHLVGQKIARIPVRQAKLRWRVDLPQGLAGQEILSVARRAKYLLLELPRGSLIVHLGMSGSLRILPRFEPPGKHDHVDVILLNGKVMRYTDPRRFGSLHFQPGAVLNHWLLERLGPEPLGDTFDGAYLHRQSRGRKTALKSLIMDQNVVVGVGNIYASEALFRAGLRPNIRASRLTRCEAARLSESIKNTLEQAIQSGGTTLRDFTAADGRPGYFKQELYAYGRQGQPCRLCGTPIKRVATGQRMSFYCPKCQR